MVDSFICFIDPDGNVEVSYFSHDFSIDPYQSLRRDDPMTYYSNLLKVKEKIEKDLKTGSETTASCFIIRGE